MLTGTPGARRSESEVDVTEPCPYCGQPVYEDAERCPACENYISQEDAPLRQSWTFRLLALICLAVAVGWVLMSL